VLEPFCAYKLKRGLFALWGRYAVQPKRRTVAAAQEVVKAGCGLELEHGVSLVCAFVRIGRSTAAG